MELAVQKRATAKKSDIKKLRREGNIPALLYSRGDVGELIVVDGIEFKKVLSTLKPGFLPSTIFTLTLDGKKIKALVKDIQYKITTYDVIHLDFAPLVDTNPVTLNVPIEFVNSAECAGVKLGGVLRQVVYHLKVRCLPKNIPSHFELDVKELGMYEKRMLSDIPLPKTVEPRMGLNTVVAVVGKR